MTDRKSRKLGELDPVTGQFTPSEEFDEVVARAGQTRETTIVRPTSPALCQRCGKAVAVTKRPLKTGRYHLRVHVCIDGTRSRGELQESV